MDFTQIFSVANEVKELHFLEGYDFITFNENIKADPIIFVDGHYS